MHFTIEFYETMDGKTPVEDFLLSLESKMRAKLVGMLELLEEQGTNLREPYTKSLGGGILELRCKLASNLTRTLFFFYTGNKIIVTNGFVKKTQKTPIAEIKLAKQRRDDYIAREKGEKK